MGENIEVRQLRCAMTCNTVKKENKEVRRVRRGFADPEGPEGFANTEGFADTENPEGFATPRARRNRGFAALHPCVDSIAARRTDRAGCALNLSSALSAPSVLFECITHCVRREAQGLEEAHCALREHREPGGIAASRTACVNANNL